jgi:uncharacterized protein (DUF362 family)
MLLGLSPLISKLLLQEAFAAEKSLVAIADDRDYAQATVKAINALGGMRRFVRPGNVVVVKPNIGWDRTPEQAANTHPLVVRAVVTEALRAGARKVKVFDRSCNDPRRCYVTSGIAAALRGMKNVELKQIENERFRPVRLNGRTLRDWELYDEALSADVFINVPVAKHHGLTGLTLGLKNVMGIMGGNRGSIHRHIDSALVDINAVVKSRLTVIDATRILTANGPQGGDPRDVKVLNKVLASSDIVAADAVATTLFGLRPEAISTTVAAYRRGLGEMNMSGIRILRV